MLALKKFFYVCHTIQSLIGIEYEISKAIDLLIQTGRTIDAIPLDGWRLDIGYPKHQEEAEQRLTGEAGGVEETPQSGA